MVNLHYLVLCFFAFLLSRSFFSFGTFQCCTGALACFFLSEQIHNLQQEVLNDFREVFQRIKEGLALLTKPVEFSFKVVVGIG